jgi:hypothetical protein
MQNKAMLVIKSFKDMLIDQLKKQMSNGHSTCPLDPMDKQNSNRHFQVHCIQWIHWTLSFGYPSGLYTCHYVIIQKHVKLIEQLKKQMSDGNSTCPLDLIDKQHSNGHFQVQWIHGSNGHFRLAISMAYYLHDVHMLVITSFKYILIDQLKKQMSNGHSICPLDQWTNKIPMDIFRSIGYSICPLDPMDTRKSNGQLEIHLTNGMSNGLLIFPSDILHGYWTLISEAVCIV